MRCDEEWMGEVCRAGLREGGWGARDALCEGEDEEDGW